MDDKLKVRYVKWNGTKLRYTYNLRTREVRVPGLPPFTATCWDDGAWEVKEALTVAEGVAGANAMPETELDSVALTSEIRQRVETYAKLMEQHKCDRQVELLGWAAFSWRLAQRKLEFRKQA